MFTTLRRFLQKKIASPSDLEEPIESSRADGLPSLDYRLPEQPLLTNPYPSDPSDATRMKDFREYCLRLWHSGNWNELAKVGCDQFETLPDRAELALLVAAAHLQTDGNSEARKLIKLSKKWGCEQHLINQVLIGGVYNSLARAATVAKMNSKAISNFRKSLPGGILCQDIQSAARLRTAEQIAQLKHYAAPTLAQSENHETISSHHGAISPSTDSDQAAIKRMKENQDQLRNRIENCEKLIIETEKRVIEMTEKKINESRRAVNSIINIQNYINTGEFVEDFTDWAICGELALWLAQLIEQNTYDLVVEFGSGTSTLIVAKSLSYTNRRRPEATPATQVAFEHLEKYQTKTFDKLKHAKLENAVSLYLVPLTSQEINEGNDFLYYDCQMILEDLSKQAQFKNILVLADGPPGTTGRHARYPALPLVKRYFPNARIDIVLDDYERTDEQEIAKIWLQDYQLAGSAAKFTHRRMEKDACLISTSAT